MELVFLSTRQISNMPLGRYSVWKLSTRMDLLRSGGKQLVQFSGGIRVAQIVYEAMIYNRLKVGSLVAAILQERDFFKADITQLDVYEHCNCDITFRLQVLDDIQNFSSNEVDFRVIEKNSKNF